MIGIQIITHGDLSESLIRSAEMIIGSFDHVAANCLTDQSPAVFQAQVRKTSQRLSQEGLLIFVDLFGATPFNTALFNARHFGPDYFVLTGANLPLLIEAILGREGQTVDTLYQQLLALSDNVVSGWQNRAIEMTSEEEETI